MYFKTHICFWQAPKVQRARHSNISFLIFAISLLSSLGNNIPEDRAKCNTKTFVGYRAANPPPQPEALEKLQLLGGIGDEFTMWNEHLLRTFICKNPFVHPRKQTIHRIVSSAIRSHVHCKMPSADDSSRLKNLQSAEDRFCFDTFVDNNTLKKFPDLVVMTGVYKPAPIPKTDLWIMRQNLDVTETCVVSFAKYGGTKICRSLPTGKSLAWRWHRCLGWFGI